MQPDERDAAYLWDMLEAAKTVLDFTRDLTFYDYQRDKMLKLAVERSIEIIGEAASRVSKEFREAHPEISGKGSSDSAMSLSMNTVRSSMSGYGLWQPSVSPIL